MLVEKLGEVTMLYVDVPGAKEPIVVKLTGDGNVERGAEVGLTDRDRQPPRLRRERHFVRAPAIDAHVLQAETI